MLLDAISSSVLLINPDIRIIIVSGYFYRDDVAIRKALEQKLIWGFIGKPFFHEEILKAVKTPTCGDRC